MSLIQSLQFLRPPKTLGNEQKLGPVLSIKNPNTQQEIIIYGCFFGVLENLKIEEILKTDRLVHFLLQQATTIYIDYANSITNSNSENEFAGIAAQINRSADLQRSIRNLLNKIYKEAKKNELIGHALKCLEDAKFEPMYSSFTGPLLLLFTFNLKAVLLVHALNKEINFCSSMQAEVLEHLTNEKTRNLPIQNAYQDIYDQAQQLNVETNVNAYIKHLEEVFRLVRNAGFEQYLEDLQANWLKGDITKLDLTNLSPLLSHREQRIDRTAKAILDLFDGKGKYFVFCSIDSLIGDKGLIALAKQSNLEVTKIDKMIA